jgi:hypothetical protein
MGEGELFCVVISLKRGVHAARPKTISVIILQCRSMPYGTTVREWKFSIGSMILFLAAQSPASMKM